MPAAWPLLPALAAFAAAMAVIILGHVQATGQFTYALDDAYIHLAIARSLAGSGTWGIAPGVFASASSSPLWTLALTAASLPLGPQLLLALVVNLVLAAGFLVMAWWLLGRSGVGPGWSAALLLALAFATPLPALVVGGMEHVAQAIAVILLAWFAAGTLARPSLVPAWPAVILAAIGTGLRYETLFLAGLLVLLALASRRWGLAAGLVLGSGLPVVAYGSYSLANGWEWLPNPLLIKGSAVALGSIWEILDTFGNRAMGTLLRAPDLMLTVILGILTWLACYRAWGGFWTRPALFLGTFVLTAIAHAQFAQVGWLFRYEAYLIAWGILAVATGLAAARPAWQPWLTAEPARRAALALLLVLLAGPLVIRGLLATVQAGEAMEDRYVEHISIARFVQQYYDGQPIVVNDIGAVAYLTNAQVLDMFGLASLEPLQFRRTPAGYSPEQADQWARAHGARVAILQTQWDKIHRRIPPSWTWAGDWQLPRNVVFRTYLVGFFAIDPAEAPRLRAHLREFAGQVPPSVRQTGPYTVLPPGSLAESPLRR